MMPEGMQPAIPPEPYLNRKGKQPSLLTDDKVRILLSSPEQCSLYLLKTSGLVVLKQT